MTTGPLPSTHEDVVPAGLRKHWAEWLGATADEVAHLGGPASTDGRPDVLVVGSRRRTAPGWDGEIHAVTGVADPLGRAVVSVPPDALDWARGVVAGGADLDGLREALPAGLGLAGHIVYRGVNRWATHPTAADELPDAGVWVPADHPGVPDWLRPFGGELLVAFDDDDDGRYLAGVGLKRHDEHGHEIAVGTDEAARGRGLARRLVAQAARHLLARGIVPTYLHDPANIASARVASAAGLPDRGWTALGSADVSRPAEEPKP
jgi:GNAT superfamily N-acetyltransferase